MQVIKKILEDFLLLRLHHHRHHSLTRYHSLYDFFSSDPIKKKILIKMKITQCSHTNSQWNWRKQKKKQSFEFHKMVGRRWRRDRGRKKWNERRKKLRRLKYDDLQGLSWVFLVRRVKERKKLNIHFAINPDGIKVFYLLQQWSFKN